MGKTYLPEGQLLRTEENAQYTASLEGLEYAKEKGIILEARVIMCDSFHNLHVDLGEYRGIIPKDEALYVPTGEPVKDIAVITRVGKSVCFMVTDIVNDGGNVKVMLSRKLAQRECCESYINLLDSGDVIDVMVTHLERFGAFCDIGCGYIALLPVDCISVSRISHPSERFENGQLIKCVVKSIDRQTSRVTLTHKELLGTWEENAAYFAPGETVSGIVRSIESYGIFVELAPNIAGLAEWCDDVTAGCCVAVYIKSIIPEKMKIKLAIVDVSSDIEHPASYGYFFEGSHLDVWWYSPKGCTKQIFTEFD